MRKYLLSLLVLLIIHISYAVNICGTNFDSNNQTIKDGTGNDAIILDKNGNFFLYSPTVNRNQGTIPITLTNYLLIKSGGVIKAAISSSTTYLLGDINQNAGVLTPGTNNFIFNSVNGVVLKIDNNGNLYSKSVAAYQNAQAGCSTDGNYCAGNIKENRDYYCRTSDRGCPYNTGATTNCGSDGYYPSYCQSGGGDNTNLVHDYHSIGCAPNGANSDCYDNYVRTDVDQNCGTNGYGGNYCSPSGSGGTVVHDYYHNGCSSNACYSTRTSTGDFVQQCSSNGCGGYYCGSGNIKQDCFNRGCSSGSCYDNYAGTTTIETCSGCGGNYCSGGNIVHDCKSSCTTGQTSCPSSPSNVQTCSGSTGGPCGSNYCSSPSGDVVHDCPIYTSCSTGQTTCPTGNQPTTVQSCSGDYCNTGNGNIYRYNGCSGASCTSSQVVSCSGNYCLNDGHLWQATACSAGSTLCGSQQIDACSGTYCRGATNEVWQTSGCNVGNTDCNRNYVQTCPTGAFCGADGNARSGSGCSNGGCVSSITETCNKYCSDSDGGDVPGTSGTVTYRTAGCSGSSCHSYGSVGDQCFVQNGVPGIYEYRCNGNGDGSSCSIYSCSSCSSNRCTGAIYQGSC